MNSFLLLLECSAYLTHLTWTVSEMEGKWQYNLFCRVWLPEFVKVTYSILLYFPSSAFFGHFVKVQMVQLYISSDMPTVWKNSHLSQRDQISIWSDKLSTADHASPLHMLISHSVDERLQPIYMNWNNLNIFIEEVDTFSEVFKVSSEKWQFM